MGKPKGGTTTSTTTSTNTSTKPSNKTGNKTSNKKRTKKADKPKETTLEYRPKTIRVSQDFTKVFYERPAKDSFLKEDLIVKYETATYDNTSKDKKQAIPSWPINKIYLPIYIQRCLAVKYTVKETTKTDDKTKKETTTKQITKVEVKFAKSWTEFKNENITEYMLTWIRMYLKDNQGNYIDFENSDWNDIIFDRPLAGETDASLAELKKYIELISKADKPQPEKGDPANKVTVKDFNNGATETIASGDEEQAYKNALTNAMNGIVLELAQNLDVIITQCFSEAASMVTEKVSEATKAITEASNAAASAADSVKAAAGEAVSDAASVAGSAV